MMPASMVHTQAYKQNTHIHLPLEPPDCAHGQLRVDSPLNHYSHKPEPNYLYKYMNQQYCLQVLCTTTQHEVTVVHIPPPPPLHMHTHNEHTPSQVHMHMPTPVLHVPTAQWSSLDCWS